MTQALAQALSAENIPQTDAEEGIGQVYREPIPRMITSCGFMPRSASMRKRIRRCMMRGSGGRRNRGCLWRQPGRRAGRMY